MMERRRYGSSGFTLPVLGIGCWAYGGGVSDYWGPQDQKDVDGVVAGALDAGINYFDTAEAYNEGRSEEAVGRALKGRRQQAIIGTKVLPAYTEPSILRQHCEASLRRLNTDFIDIYMVHWPIVDQPVEGAFATLAALQAEGKIRSIGVSNFGIHQLQEALSTGARIEVNQLCYNLLSRGIEIDLMPFCASRKIGILAYSPLGQGLLTGKFRSVDEIPPARTRTRHFRGDRPGSRHGEAGAEEEVFTALEGLRQVAQELQAPVAQVALAWCLGRPEITCVLPGIRTAEQLEENQAGATIKLTLETQARLDRLTLALREKLGASPDYYQGRNDSRTW
jgi:aryl-alcohol dehydrogenase-like predicted oxidoreductase